MPEQIEEISRSEIARIVGHVAYARGSLEAEQRMTDKNFLREIEGLEEVTEILLEDVIGDQD